MLAANEHARAGVLDPVAAELPPGAQPVRLDFLDPTTAASALVGVDRLFLLRPPAISDVTSALGLLAQAAAVATRDLRHCLRPTAPSHDGGMSRVEFVPMSLPTGTG